MSCRAAADSVAAYAVTPEPGREIDHIDDGRVFAVRHAAWGWNNQVDVPGSPTVFWALAHELLDGMRVPAMFVDIDGGLVTELAQRIALDELARERSKLVHGDNAVALAEFAAAIRRHERKPGYAVGSVLVDPNG